MLDVDPDVYLSVGRTFLDANSAVCDIMAAAAQAANSAHGMAGADSTGVAWARDYDDAAWSLLRAGATVVDALGAVGDRLSVSGTNHEAADAASVPGGNAGAGPPAYSGAPGTGRAVAVVVSTPPSADGTPDDPPPGWSLIAHLLAYTWPAGHPEQLRGVGAGWLRASLSLSDRADRLTGPIANLSGQLSPEVPYAVDTCTGLQTAMRSLADQLGIVAHVCDVYAGHLDQAHHDVYAELLQLLAEEAVIEIVGGIATVPTEGLAQIPTQAAAGARLTAAALRIGRILSELATQVLAAKTLIQGITEHVVSVLLMLEKVTAQRETLQAVTALITAGIPPIDLQTNEKNNPKAHVIKEHVEKSDTYLMGRNKLIASTFTSMAAATTAISTLMAASGTHIATWLRGTDPELILHGLLPNGAGRSYLRMSDQFVSATTFRIVLRRNSSGYFIFTAYPEP